MTSVKRFGYKTNIAAAFAVLIILLLAPAATRAQWTTDGSGNAVTTAGVNNVGVGASSPAEKLTVAGSIVARGTSAIAGSQFIITNNDTTGPWIGVHTDSAGNSTANYAAARLGMQAAGFFFQLSPQTSVGSSRTWTTRMAIDATTGNVGIGTSSPGGQLSVSGTSAAGGSVEAHILNSAANGYQSLRLGTDSTSAGSPLWINAFNSSWTTAGWSVADSGGVYGTGSGGLNIGAGHASGVIRFYTGGGNSTNERMRVDAAGNVGIGTTSPGAKLDVRGNISLDGTVPAAHAATGYSALWLKNNVALIPEIATGYSILNIGTNYQRTGAGWSAINTGSSTWVLSMGSGPTWDQFQVTRSPAGSTLASSTFFVISSLGNVGIGTPTPGASYKLDVNGDTHVTGAISTTGAINAGGAITGATINATYQDVAEWVPSTQKLQAGTVVVLDPENMNHVLASTSAYDTKVAGVVSDTPGVILGQGSDEKLKVATTGRVRVKVDATRAPIHVGDLLVTSDTEGVAMKSVEVDLGGVKIHRPGTIIGKALESLASGTGEILVLLSLQ